MEQDGFKFNDDLCHLFISSDYFDLGYYNVKHIAYNGSSPFAAYFCVLFEGHEMYLRDIAEMESRESSDSE